MTISPALNDILRRTGLSDEQLRGAGVNIANQPLRPTGPKLLDAAHAPQPKTPVVARVVDLACVKRLPLKLLHELGLKDVVNGVSIEYRLIDGSLAPRQRIRCSPPGEKNRSIGTRTLALSSLTDWTVYAKPMTQGFSFWWKASPIVGPSGITAIQHWESPAQR